jgi:hypothetical protein
VVLRKLEGASRQPRPQLPDSRRGSFGIRIERRSAEDWKTSRSRKAGRCYSVRRSSNYPEDRDVSRTPYTSRNTRTTLRGESPAMGRSRGNAVRTGAKSLPLKRPAGTAGEPEPLRWIRGTSKAGPEAEGEGPFRRDCSDARSS